MKEIIKVENLKKEFGRNIALKGINFSIEKGEVFGYLGPNGAGKTTTMRILLGILRPTSGRVMLFDKDISKDSSEIRGRIGFVLEDQRLYERLTAHDNLEYYARIYQVPKVRIKEKIRKLLEIVGLWGNKDEIVGKFSKGMKQKLAIARSLVHDPEVLFYDEPTLGLDPEIQLIIRDLIIELAKEEKKTIFLNSHNLAEVQKICSKVAIIKKGEILKFDLMKNLQNKQDKPTIEVVAEDVPRNILEEIKNLNFVTDCRQEINKLIIGLTSYNKNQEIFSFLVERNIKIHEIKEVTKTLEDIYISLVKESEE